MIFWRREFSVVLLLLGMTVIYAGVLLSAGTSGAQTTGGTTADTTDDTTRDRIGGRTDDTNGATQYTTQYNTQYSAQAGADARAGQSDEDCTNPQVVETFTGTGNQQTAPFEIQGTLFRITSEVTATEDPDSFFYSVTVNDENGDFVTSVGQEQPGTESSFVNAGPGSFFLDVSSLFAEYTITVESCTGTNGGNGGGGGNGSNVGITERRNGDVIINVPQKPLPPTGGLPVSLMVGGFVLAGAGLLAWSFAAQRGRQR